eukprot:gene7277-392_t
MEPGTTRQYTLPVAVTDHANFLRILTPEGVYFVNHRRTQLPSEELPQDFNGKVLIYRFDFGPHDARDTQIIKGLSKGHSWSTPHIKVKVLRISLSKRSATILVCRLGVKGDCGAKPKQDYPAQPAARKLSPPPPTPPISIPNDPPSLYPPPKYQDGINLGRSPSDLSIATPVFCKPRNFILSFSGSSGLLINSLGATCSDGSSTNSTTDVHSAVPFVHSCPSGFDAVTAADPEFGSVVQLSLRCRSTQAWTKEVGSLQYPSAPHPTLECTPGYLITGLLVVSAASAVRSVSFKPLPPWGPSPDPPTYECRDADAEELLNQLYRWEGLQAQNSSDAENVGRDQQHGGRVYTRGAQGAQSGSRLTAAEEEARPTCPQMAALGKCLTEAGVLQHCRKSCGVCPGHAAYFCLPDGVDAAGSILAALSLTPEECMAACSSNMECSMYQVMSGGWCNLKSNPWKGMVGHNGARAATVVKSCVKFDFGESDTQGEGSYLCLPPMVNVGGYIIASSAVDSLGECKLACLNHPLCEAVVWALNGECSLRTDPFQGVGSGTDKSTGGAGGGQACLRATRGRPMGY